MSLLDWISLDDASGDDVPDPGDPSGNAAARAWPQVRAMACAIPTPGDDPAP